MMVTRLPSPFGENELELWNVEFWQLKKTSVKTFTIKLYHKYPNLVRTKIKIISNPNYLVCIHFESNCIRIYFSCFTKVCNIQIT